jgi:hypothetical protein
LQLFVKDASQVVAGGRAVRNETLFAIVGFIEID